jgi:hypothetical protein
VVTSVLAQCQMLVSGCLELKEAALATTGDSSSSSSADVEIAKWQEKGSELMREANELRKKAQELKKQSAVNKYGTEEQLKKDMRLYLQHKKSLANFNGFTEGMALALAFVSLRFLSLSSLSRFSAPLLAHGADIQQSEILTCTLDLRSLVERSIKSSIAILSKTSPPSAQESEGRSRLFVSGHPMGASVNSHSSLLCSYIITLWKQSWMVTSPLSQTR